MSSNRSVSLSAGKDMKNNNLVQGKEEEEDDVPNSKDIDIVGAISTLNLDDDDEATASTTSPTDKVVGVNDGLIYGSLTPQASSKGKWWRRKCLESCYSTGPSTSIK